MSRDQPAHARAAAHQEHDSHTDDMLSPSSSSSSLLLAHSSNNINSNSNSPILDTSINTSSSNAIYIVNTSVHHVIEASSSSSNSNSSTPRAAQQSNGFYQSYDPSTGLHTAAVLGGFLVWLVLYVIYRTKIRKYAIAAIKRTFGSLDPSVKKPPDSDAFLSRAGGGSAYRNASKPLINPSIVIETSPPQSPTKSISTCDQLTKVEVQECFSPYSLPAGNMKDDMMVFQFPGSLHGLGHADHHHHHHHHHHHGDALLHRLPISEMDIPTATAQWVQNMPLAARSYQDFAGLMLNMQARKFLPMDKPGSCPLVYVTPPPTLPVLDIPQSWNNSLPMLSSSVSDYLLNAYESVNTHKELKELINAKRKLSEVLKKNDDSPDENMINENEVDSNRLSARSEDKFDKSLQNHKNEKRKGKRSPGLTIDIPQIKDTLILINNTSMSRSPVPLPVTPTVMIQNSTKAPSRRRVCNDSNTSLSSSSSDLLQGATNALSASPPRPTIPPPIHITGPLQEHSMYHPSFTASFDAQHASGCFECSHNTNAPSPCRGHPGGCMYNMYPYHHHQCSIKNSKSEEFTNPNAVASKFQRYGSLKESSYMWRQSCKESNPHHHNSPVSYHHRRSMSSYNNRSKTNPGFHQRSLSADMSSIPAASGLNRSNEHGSSYSLGLGPSPSPNFLRVPDSNSNPSAADNSFFLDTNPNSTYFMGHGGSSSDLSCRYNGGEYSCNAAPPSPTLFHGSDRNISYYGSPHRPISPLVDTPHNIIRRHSSNFPLSGRTQLVHCPDIGTARPSSSSSYFYPIQHQEPSPSSSSPSQHQDRQQSQQQSPQQQHQQQQQQQQQQQYLQQHVEEHKTRQQQQHEMDNCDDASRLFRETPPTKAKDPPLRGKKSSSNAIVMETKL